MRRFGLVPQIGDHGRPGPDGKIMCDDWPGNQMVEVLEEAAGESEVWACMVSTTL